jgi:hypothetical protein
MYRVVQESGNIHCKGVSTWYVAILKGEFMHVFVKVYVRRGIRSNYNENT